jgi:hypothetical protein
VGLGIVRVDGREREGGDEQECSELFHHLGSLGFSR